MRFVNVSILLVSIVFAGTVTQTDWSGGGGEEGPVSNWYDLFWSSDNIDFDQEELKLLISPIEHLIDGDFDYPVAVLATDVDGDGDIDVLGSSWFGGGINWWENTDGLGTTWAKHTVYNISMGAGSIYADDVNGDGSTDVLSIAYLNNIVYWWENVEGAGVAWVKHVVKNSFEGALSVHSADIDGDGDTDILGAAQTDDDITWWENTDGTGSTWMEHIVDDDYNGACCVYSDDFDSDGDADILGASVFSDNITWWENLDGEGTSWMPHSVDVNVDAPTSICSSDIDGDSDRDVLATDMFEDEIIWYENTDGVGISWTKHVIDEAFEYPNSIHASDIDGDGDIDVLGAAEHGHDITWWENTDGTGLNWTKRIVDDSFWGANSVCTGDIDGDGALDVIGSARYADDIAWWDITDFEPIGTLESSILDAGDIEEWNSFIANVQAPSGSSVGYQFRSSDDSSNMGIWSDTILSSEIPLEGILADSTRYLQYKIILETADTLAIPVLSDLSFSYTLTTGTEENESDDFSSWSLSTLQNPSHGFFSALVTVPETVILELSLYDVSGRVITKTSQEFVTGTHSVNFTGLATGVYFCTMQAEQFSATERIVVID